MEFLFTANLSVGEKDMAYEVHFENEKYTFIPQENQSNLSPFSFKREHDEWHEQEPVSAPLKKQAIDALENYLLAQH